MLSVDGVWTLQHGPISIRYEPEQTHTSVLWVALWPSGITRNKTGLRDFFLFLVKYTIYQNKVINVFHDKKIERKVYKLT